MKDQELLRVLVKEKAVVKLLRTIDNREYHTRELLHTMKEWGYGHKILLKAEGLGLVERKRVKPEGKGNHRVYNKLSEKGVKVLRLAEKIGV